MANNFKARIEDQPGSTACMVGRKGIVRYQLPPLCKTTNSMLHCEQLERSCQVIERKRERLMKRKNVCVSYSTTTKFDITRLWWLAKNSKGLVGKFWCIHRMVQIWHLQFTQCFDLWKFWYWNQTGLKNAWMPLELASQPECAKFSSVSSRNIMENIVWFLILALIEASRETPRTFHLTLKHGKTWIQPWQLLRSMRKYSTQVHGSILTD